MKTGYFSYICHPDLFLIHLEKINPDIDRIIEEICFKTK